MKKAALIVFGEDWNRHPSSTQHLMVRLASERRILWVNSIGLRRPRFNRSDLARARRKAAMMLTRQSAATTRDDRPENPSVIDPWALSWPGAPLVSAVNRRLFSHRLSQAAAALGDRPILWCSLPSAVDAVGLFNEAGVVYYAGDDFSALEGVDHGPVERQERALCARADLVIAASPALKTRLEAMGARDVMVLEHGCDVGLFSTPVSRAADLPDGAPVAGYYGAIADWLDTDLILDVANAARDWRFVFIGPVKTDIDRLRAARNITILPAVAHERLPAYSQHWDVSLLPFRDTAQIRACNSLKMREYLAAGSPVVATTPTPLHGLEAHIAKAATPDAFLAALNLAARKKSTEDAARRRAAVADQSWDARAADLDAGLERRFTQFASQRVA